MFEYGLSSWAVTIPTACRCATVYTNRTARLAIAVVRHLGRTLLAEVTEVVYELHAEIAANTAVPSILSITRTGRTCERCVLVEDVVYTHLNLSALVLEDLAAEIYVAQYVILIILVGETEVLNVRYSRCEGQSLEECPLYVTIYRVVEVVVLSGVANGVPCLVVSSVPRNCKVEVLRNVTTECYASVVTDVVCVVGVVDVVNHILQYITIACSVDCRRCTVVDYTSSEIEVTLHK